MGAHPSGMNGMIVTVEIIEGKLRAEIPIFVPETQEQEHTKLRFGCT